MSSPGVAVRTYLDHLTVERETARHHLVDAAVAGADQVTLQASNRVVNAAISRFLYQYANRDGEDDADADDETSSEETA